MYLSIYKGGSMSVFFSTRNIAFNASTASTIGLEDHFFLSMATGP